jgi:hypothetical protein
MVIRLLAVVIKKRFVFVLWLRYNDEAAEVRCIANIAA